MGFRPRFLQVAIVVGLSMAIAGCEADSSSFSAGSGKPGKGDLKIAFMPDIHFHDVYAHFEDGVFAGLPNSISGKNATIRTMYAQLTSTRLFNENYFAFIAALDDAVAKGVRYIALPGDFSDDGQPIHVLGLKKVLDEYSTKHGIEFFAAPGNHDPNVPFARPAGKSDFLGVDGKEQGIYSKGANVCAGYSGRTALIDGGGELPTACTEDIQEMGYAGVTQAMENFGFKPKKKYVYWETPYSDYTQENYSFDKATAEADWSRRRYEICNEGTGGKYRKEGYTHCLMVPDTSYLVEPVPGVWLLAIDANVYRPKQTANDADPSNPNNFDGSGNAGYNMMLTHKQQVMDWIADVVKRANASGKQLVAFSHFPMTDFYNGAADDIEELFGQGSFQMARKPQEDTTKTLADTGLRVHVGGHMHFNDTGVRDYGNGEYLVNIQAPSLAAYVPAYKLLHLRGKDQIEVETIALNEVPRFNELFQHYEQEHQHLLATGSPNLWNKDILKATNYHDFNSIYLSELTRLRFLPSEWPCEMRELIFNLNGEQMMTLAQLNTSVTLGQLQQIPGLPSLTAACTDMLATTPQTEPVGNIVAQWAQARAKAKALAQANGLTLESFAEWKGLDLATDFYRIANAGDLGLKDIGAQRAQQYKLLSGVLAATKVDIKMNGGKISADNHVGAVFQSRFRALFEILDKLANGAPSDHFMINLGNGSVTDMVSQSTQFKRKP